MRHKKPSKLLLFVGTAIVIFSIILILHSINFASNLNLILTDNLYGGKSPLNSIVIIGIDDKSIQEIGRWPWDRAVFANLTRNIGSPKIIGFDIGFYDSTSSDQILSNSFIGKKVVLASQVNSFKSEGVAESFLTPQPILLQNTTTGYVNILTHPDGVTRTVNFNLSPTINHFDYEIFEQSFNQPRIPLSAYYINFPSVPYTFHILSASDVITGKIEPSTFKNKIVLIGATSASLKDHYFVPTSNGVAMPGVEVHASIIQTLLNQNNLIHQSNITLYLTIISFVILVGVFVFFLRPILTLVLLLGLIVLYEFIAILFFDYNILLNLIYPPLTIMFSYPLFYAVSYSIEQRERKKIERAFGKYLSPTVVSHLLENKDRVQLGGEERELTIFFSDIRGFTALSEKLTPAELISTLNQYFSAMSSIIVKNRGIVDKYIGDAIMAFWGAPKENKNHATDATTSALEMKRALRRIRIDLAKKGIEIDIGIGINTGQVVVGNIGSEERFDYTVIGDSVNLASRIEGLTKEYGVMIIITSHTKHHLTPEFVTRELDLVAVKGKTEPVALFELFDLEENVESDTREFIQIYESALSLYRKGEFESAKIHFQESYARKHDKTSKLMIERCEKYIKNPPENWTGVYIANTK